MLELLAAGTGVEPWLPTGEVSWVQLDGRRVMVAVDPDRAEIQRRSRLGLGAVLSRRVLHALNSLPTGVAVPLSLVDPDDRRILRGLPDSVIEWHGSELIVVLRPAVSLLSVGVLARRWHRGLELTSPFASYCARYVVLSGYRDEIATPWVQAKARFYGVGLAVLGDGRLDWKVAPAPFRPERFTAASWLMAEQVTEALQY